MSLCFHLFQRDRAQKVLNRWFPNEERQDQRDFEIAYKDLLAFWYFTC